TISSFLYPVVKECFSEVNPIAVKEALTILGYPVGPPRPPLTRLSKNNRKRLISVLEKFLSEVNEF
ncbi:MAG: dihydrodipicolinate synthase family protein, partial [Clostridia bacterium]|nr:dihydrodipicolinate synthase family protein [Clostridia bacterium]